MMVIKWLITIDCNFQEIKKKINQKVIGWVEIYVQYEDSTQPAITCSKLTIETLEQGMKYVQS